MNMRISLYVLTLGAVGALGLLIPLGARSQSAHSPNEFTRFEEALRAADCTTFRAFLRDFPSGRFSQLISNKVNDAGCGEPALDVSPPSPLREVPLASGAGEADKSSSNAYERTTPAVPEPTPRRGAVPAIPTVGPVAAVHAYYSALDRSDAEAATRAWLNPPESLSDNVRNNEYFRVRKAQLVSDSRDRAMVRVDVTGKDWGRRPENWLLVIHLVRVGDVWKIERMARD